MNKTVEGRVLLVAIGFLMMLFWAFGCSHVTREIEAGCECRSGEDNSTSCSMGGKGRDTEVKP